jgi:lipoprotein-anchoring transpeptidase ErfK/SrfK
VIRLRTIAIVAACALVAGVAFWLVGRDGDDGAPARAASASTEAPDEVPAPLPVTVPASTEPKEPREDPIPPKPSRAPEHPRPPHLLELPRDGHPIVWVRGGETAQLRAAPGGQVVRDLGRQTEFGSVHAFSVVRRSGPWAGVPTPYRDNDELGWLRLDERRLASGSTPYEIRVDLSSFRAALVRGDDVLHSFPVTIGAEASPTPTGRFAVTDTFRGNLNPAYGCCALALTARQPNLPSGWFGGDRIAIHGTSGGLGVAASNGCVRARDADVSLLVDEAGVGTPVIIRE